MARIFATMHRSEHLQLFANLSGIKSKHNFLVVVVVGKYLNAFFCVVNIRTLFFCVVNIRTVGVRVGFLMRKIDLPEM